MHGTKSLSPTKINYAGRANSTQRKVIHKNVPRSGGRNMITTAICVSRTSNQIVGCNCDKTLLCECYGKTAQPSS